MFKYYTEIKIYNKKYSLEVPQMKKNT